VGAVVQVVGDRDLPDVVEIRAAMRQPHSLPTHRPVLRRNNKLIHCDARYSNCSRKSNCCEIRLMQVLHEAGLAARDLVAKGDLAAWDLQARALPSSVRTVLSSILLTVFQRVSQLFAEAVGIREAPSNACRRGTAITGQH